MIETIMQERGIIMLSSEHEHTYEELEGCEMLVKLISLPPNHRFLTSDERYTFHQQEGVLTINSCLDAWHPVSDLMYGDGFVSGHNYCVPVDFVWEEEESPIELKIGDKVITTTSIEELYDKLKEMQQV